jgi:hypothetical protein
MNPNLNNILLLMALLGNRDKDERFLQFFAVASLLGTSSMPPATTTSVTPTTACPPATQCDLLLLALVCGGGHGLFGGFDRDRDRPPHGAKRKEE